MNISIFGTGYVGLVTGTCFSVIGHNVLCIDIDSQKIELLNSGKVPIYEPGLEELINKSIENKLLKFSTEIEDAISHSNIYFIAVGTPQSPDGSANLDYVLNLARDLGKILTNNSLIVIKSTVPVGTADRVSHVINHELNNRFENPPTIEVVSNPEFLKEGQAIDDFMKPDRVIIGSEHASSGAMIAELYSPLDLHDNQMILMDNRSAELTKYAANAMLATRISFMNQIANICEKSGADIEQIKIGIGSDSRIGKQFLNAGVGYGGSCFPKDVKALMRLSEILGADGSKLLEAVDRVNEDQKLWHLRKSNDYFNSLENKKIGVWGLSFKPETDDIREATSISVVGALLSEGAKVVAYDPIAGPTFNHKIQHPNLVIAADSLQVLENIDALFILTEWKEFKDFNISLLKEKLSGKAIFDGRNIYSDEQLGSEVTYYSVGHKKLV